MAVRINAEYQAKITGIDTELSRMASTGYHYTEGIKALELANNVKSLWNVVDKEEKANILKLLASNYTLNGEKLIPAYRKPFSALLEINNNSSWYR